MAVVLALVVLPPCATADAASTGRASKVIGGLVAAFTDRVLDIKAGDGTIARVRLDADWSLVEGRAIGRQGLWPGEAVGVSAFVVHLPVGDRLIARGFATVDPSFSKPEAVRLLGRFLGPLPAQRAGDHGPPVRRLVGTFMELRPGGLLVVRVRGRADVVKLGPETYGYQLSHTARRSFAVGDKVTLLARGGRTTEVFLLLDEVPAPREGAAP